jgi:hypothetical protein
MRLFTPCWLHGTTIVGAFAARPLFERHAPPHAAAAAAAPQSHCCLQLVRCAPGRLQTVHHNHRRYCSGPCSRCSSHGSAYAALGAGLLSSRGLQGHSSRRRAAGTAVCQPQGMQVSAGACQLPLVGGMRAARPHAANTQRARPTTPTHARARAPAHQHTHIHTRAPQRTNTHTYTRTRAPEALWGLAVAPVLPAAHAHDLAVDRRAHAVVHLAVDLGQHIACVCARARGGACGAVSAVSAVCVCVCVCACVGVGPAHATVGQLHTPESPALPRAGTCCPPAADTRTRPVPCCPDCCCCARIHRSPSTRC